ncbi:hypothetical protein MNBD_GAMMA12-765 [hydrothermal vent metagenome]|uniref:Porin domain-containing protein n=1 Tax=hydrothermal vent metagenome TaxID=652676 RepID=A0A3B0Y2Z9_9ZZZZ
MNKKILALAVGSALALPMVAQAKVVVYGHAQVEIGNIDTGVTDQNFSRDQSRGRFGIKASEKLGNGMTAYAKFEFATDTSDGNRAPNSPLSPREHAVGLKGAFGAVELGRLKTPYKYFGGVTYDPFVATNLEARGNGGQTGGSFGHNSFRSNSIAWKSNNFNGLSVWLLASIDEEDGTDGDYSIGVRYKAGPFEVGVTTINDDSANLDRTKLFGQYKWGNHKFSGSFEASSAGAVDTDTLFLGYQLRSGNNTFAAQYGNTDPDSGVETDYFAIGMIHHLSKKTRVFGGYRSTDVDAGTETEVFSVGLRVLF